MRLFVSYGVTLPKDKELTKEVDSKLIAYMKGAQNWTSLHRAADARDADSIIKCLSEECATTL